MVRPQDLLTPRFLFSTMMTLPLGLLVACGETATNQTRNPEATNKYANGTIEQCSADKEKNASNPQCSAGTTLKADPVMTAAEKNLQARVGSSVTVSLQSKPSKGVTLTKFGVMLFGSSGYAPVSGFPEQITDVSYGNARFCVFVPPEVAPGSYTARFYAIGSIDGVAGVFDQPGQTLEIPISITPSVTTPGGPGSGEDIKKLCPNTSTQSDTAAGSGSPDSPTTYTPPL